MSRHSKLLPFFLFLLFTNGLCAIESPYPEGLIYPQGFMPAILDDDLLESEYERWEKNFVVECNSGYRVTGENSGETRVEGIGFGMIITAFCGKKEVFDGLYKFYKSKRTASAGQMMARQVSCSGINDQGSATDGDIDHDLAGRSLFRFNAAETQTLNFTIPEKIGGCVLLTAHTYDGSTRSLGIVHLP